MLKSNDLALTTRVSGKTWKRPRKPINSLNQKVYRYSLEEKLKLKDEKAADRKRRDDAKNGLIEKKREMREKKAAQEARRIENAKKNDVVVEIKNIAKLKRMKKKQLRSITTGNV